MIIETNGSLIPPSPIFRIRSRLWKTQFRDISGLRLPKWESGVVGKLLAFLWGSGELPRTTSCGISPISFLPRESRSFPTTPFDVREIRTPIPRGSVSHSSHLSRHKALWIKLLRSECPLWRGLYYPFPSIIQADFPEVVSRTFHGKGAEGNGETPAGKEC
ncbi:hypothetical protein DYE48_14310 [Halobacillus trueperi]|uniref:Uncharacterized protein n=1 Tax=Halobacillus trueperi TaxID=156205 RepID=A0A3E0J681_9BACI|nr:hypothetical protein DYE48_14310 [Halobacillus trueperi]